MGRAGESPGPLVPILYLCFAFFVSALCPRKLTSMDPGPCTSLGVPPMKESAEERNIGIMIPAPCQAIVLKWLGSSTYGTTLIGGPSPQTQLSLVPTTISPSSASGLRVAMFPLLLVLK